MSSSSTFAESVASCRARTPIPSPSPAAKAAAAALPDATPLLVRRKLDFHGGDGNVDDDDDDDDDFLFRAAEEMERSLHDLKRRPSQGLTLLPPPVALAPPTFPEKQCICGRGPCEVEWKPGGWAYVCSASPVNLPLPTYLSKNTSPSQDHLLVIALAYFGKCKHSAYCEESDVNPNSQHAFGSHPEPNYPHVSNTWANRMANATTQVNVTPQGAGVITPVIVSPQGASATTPVNCSPQGAKSSGVPTCKCTAGECRTAIEKGVLYYVCHIPKGQGACSHREPINAATEVPLTGYKNPRETEHLVYNPVTNEANGHNIVMMGGHNETIPFSPDEPPEYDDWPFDIVDGDVVPTDYLSPSHPSSIPVIARGSPIMPQQPVGMVELETPTKSPMPPKYTISTTAPRSNSCYQCGEEGHFAVNCPKNVTAVMWSAAG